MSENIYKRNTILNPNVIISDSKYQSLKIAQWNIFAQGFVEADKYQYCSSSDLTLRSRSEMFRREFNYINADIYCFQEADIHKTLYDILNEYSDKYFEIFVSNENSPCLLYPNNYGPDGCSIIYNKDRLMSLNHCAISLDDSGNHMCLFALFCFKCHSDLKFIVISTHLKSKKGFAKLRQKQCSLILSKLNNLMSQWKTSSVFLCGDFNASPNEDVIKTLQNSSLNFINVYDELRPKSNLVKHYTTWTFRKDRSESKRISLGDSMMRSLDDSYASKYDGEYEDILDYIWYTRLNSNISQFKLTVSSSIISLSILDVPDKKDIGIHGIPSVNKYPSDHLSLVADFIIEKIS